jgi:hypothetical protein
MMLPGKVYGGITVINIAAIPGVTAPVTGATPVTTITETTQYTGTITWSGSPVTFAASTAYTATITLTAKAGYTLEGVAANFFTVSGATATNTVNLGVVTAAFPATAAAATPIGTSTPSPINYVQQIVGAGSVIVDASGAYAIVTGSGGQTITIYGISGSSASERGFSVGGATVYGDLHVNSSEGIEKIQFIIIGGAGKPWWLAGSKWIECSDYTIEANGDVIITITNSTSPKISELTGTVFTVFGKPWVRTMPMTCSRVWINEDNKFQFVFQYPYRDNNWVRIYDASGKMVYEIDMPYDDPNLIVDLPGGTYTVKTFTVGSTEPLQTFVIGKP